MMHSSFPALHGQHENVNNDVFETESDPKRCVRQQWNAIKRYRSLWFQNIDGHEVMKETIQEVAR